MNLKLFVAITGLLALIIAGIYIVQRSNEKTADLPLPPAQEVVEALPGVIELADTQAKRTQGLSGRDIVADDYGMLFVFDAAGRHGFWMKDMKVAIDIIWIAEEGSIVYIEHNLAPDSYPTVVTPPTPARYVLETRAGYARERDWGVGTKLELAPYQN